LRNQEKVSFSVTNALLNQSSWLGIRNAFLEIVSDIELIIDFLANTDENNPNVQISLNNGILYASDLIVHQILPLILSHSLPDMIYKYIMKISRWGKTLLILLKAITD
jgi:hypothetical protein